MKPVFAPDGKTVALRGVGRGHVSFFDVERNALHPSPKNQDALTSVALSPDARTMLVAGVAYNYVHLWDLSGVEEPRNVRVENRGPPSLAFSPDSKTLAATHRNES